MFEEVESASLEELDYKELVALYDKLNNALCKLVAWYLAESVSMVLADYVDKELDNLSLSKEDISKYKI